MKQRDFMLNKSHLAPIFQALLNQNPDAPRIFPLDTEYTNRRAVAEIEIYDVKADQIVVDVVFDPVLSCEQAYTCLTP